MTRRPGGAGRAGRRDTVAGTFAPGDVVVALHAHPDDETLLTGGTLAALAAAGHRTVLVTATDGEAGLTGDATGDTTGGDLGSRRALELDAAAAALGVSRVVRLHHGDSGLRGDAPVPDRFADADVTAVARAVAAVLREERADVLLGYDAAGGYGHPDHRQVHRVARAAAALAGTPRLLEATVDRRRLRPALAALSALRPLLRHVLPVPDLPEVADGGWSDPGGIAVRLDVRAQVPAKQRALRAHASQATGGLRTVALLARIPSLPARWVLGTEWFCETGGPRGPVPPISSAGASTRGGMGPRGRVGAGSGVVARPR